MRQGKDAQFHSLAGKTKHNALAERNNQFLLVATTTCMLEAGVPPCFWRYAITCVSHPLNIEPNDDEVSAYGANFMEKSSRAR